MRTIFFLLSRVYFNKHTTYTANRSASRQVIKSSKEGKAPCVSNGRQRHRTFLEGNTHLSDLTRTKRRCTISGEVGILLVSKVELQIVILKFCVHLFVYIMANAVETWVNSPLSVVTCQMMNFFRNRDNEMDWVLIFFFTSMILLIDCFYLMINFFK